MSPKVAIVGRPNVGKSALFNRLVGSRVAIVDEEEGITRDRLEREIEFYGNHITLIDTGGIHAKSKAPFNDFIKWQALTAIEEADALLFVVDVQVGITQLDEEVAKILHHTDKPVVLCVNKVDHQNLQSQVGTFYSLGFPDIFPISCAHGWNVTDACEKALESLDLQGLNTQEKATQVAIVGRPNVGKSSLVNNILEDERCIVSPIAGTTRDSIDVEWEFHEHRYTLIDTAGIRKKPKEKEVVDKFAAIRTKESILRCDICILMIDATQGLTHQEKGIINDVEDAGKPLILLLNKWDLVHDIRMEHALKGLQLESPFIEHCPKVVISCQTKRNLDQIFPVIESIRLQKDFRISTGEFNNFIEKTLQIQPPPMIQGKRLRIYYATQIQSSPPTFLLFVNYPKLLRPSYRRYLLNQIRKHYKFQGYPIRFLVKGKEAKEHS